MHQSLSLSVCQLTVFGQSAQPNQPCHKFLPIFCAFIYIKKAQLFFRRPLTEMFYRHLPVRLSVRLSFCLSYHHMLSFYLCKCLSCPPLSYLSPNTLPISVCRITFNLSIGRTPVMVLTCLSVYVRLSVMEFQNFICFLFSTSFHRSLKNYLMCGCDASLPIRSWCPVFYSSAQKRQIL